MKKVNKISAEQLAEVEKVAEEAKSVAEVAVLEAKEETSKLADEVKVAQANAKSDLKAAEAKARKAVKKTTKKVAKKAEAVKAACYVQFAGMEVAVDELHEKAKAAFRAEHKRMPIKSINLYVKPEDHAAYYVINDEYTGKVEL